MPAVYIVDQKNGIAYGQRAMTPIRSGVRRSVLCVATVVGYLLAVAGCSSGPEPLQTIEPPPVGVFHFDVAFQLVSLLPLAERLVPYAEAARELASQGRLEAAHAVLTDLDRIIARVDDEIAMETWIARLAAWHALAARDETRVARTAELDDAMLERLEGVADARQRADLTVAVLTIQLTNPNADIERVRSTLDAIYLIEDNRVRAATLVDVADGLSDQNDRVSLNPVVQQAIALLPSIDDPLTRFNVAIRLALKSRVLGRESDVEALRQQSLRAAQAGLTVPRERREVLAEAMRAYVTLDDVARAESSLALVIPQWTRALAHADLGTALAQNGRADRAGAAFAEAQRQSLAVADAAERAATASDVIYQHSVADRSWDPRQVSAQVLEGVRSALEDESRVEAIAAISAAFHLSGHAGDVDRLRGLILDASELANVTVRVAERLADAGATSAARDVLSQLRTADSLEATRRSATTWVRLGNYDRAANVLDTLPPRQTAMILFGVPVSHQFNPAAVVQLDRLVSVRATTSGPAGTITAAPGRRDQPMRVPTKSSPARIAARLSRFAPRAMITSSPSISASRAAIGSNGRLAPGVQLSPTIARKSGQLTASSGRASGFARGSAVYTRSTLVRLITRVAPKRFASSTAS